MRRFGLHFAIGVVWLPAALGSGADCEAVRRAWQHAAQSGLHFYADGSSTGAALTEPRDQRARKAQEALAEGVAALSRLDDFEEVCVGIAEHPEAARTSHRLFLLLLQSREEGRSLLAEGLPLDEELSLLDGQTPWSELLHSGWPVFLLAAAVEMEFRDPPTQSLHAQRLYRQEPSEGCREDQEVLHQVTMLYAAEGRTARIMDLRHFLRQEVEGNPDVMAGPEFLLDLAAGQPRAPDTCRAALSVAYAALADALQCHWRRPRSRRMHELADAAVNNAQEGALAAFGSGPAAFSALLRSRWPLLSFLGRLQPRPLTPPVSPPAVVSWSSREAELGGMNWAEHFATEVFSGLEGVELEPDLECADIYVYRSKVPVNFGGVLIFVDGERSPEDSLQEGLLRSYPASIVVGPLPAGGLADFFPVPAASTSFAARLMHTPMALTRPRTVEALARPGFVAYLVYRCYPHREHFFSLLETAARATPGLGPVESLSRCGNAPERERRSDRYSASYYDDAVALFRGFRFAMVFENRLSPRYVTEKIVNAFLSGVMKLFNPRAFIYVNGFISFEAAVAHVLRVAQDAELYRSYAEAPVLRNTSAWAFSWHRDAPLPEQTSLREALATLALQKHREALQGALPAIERRPFDYVDLFPA
ncbi:unnamed protein product [Effrenium voratum]|uniref:Fucosyltransferase n=1 Tax=Effrenium voratum TaxID=2562239 RepID=A0AA36N4W8_9DINO|nr:unnamed protein product [Effrenium voratum]